MISVIVPLHNEAHVLPANLPMLRKALDGMDEKYEIILAEDGSTDNTRSAAESASSGNVRVISSEKRLGRGLALSNALKSAKGEIVIYMDADLATDLRHLKGLVAMIRDGADIATGSRLVPGSMVHGRSITREFFSRGYNGMLRLLFRTSVRDHQCGFKAFRRSSVVPLLGDVKDNHWFWDSELLILAQMRGMKVKEMPVEWTDHKSSSVNLVSDIVGMGAAAARMRLRSL